MLYDRSFKMFLETYIPNYSSIILMCKSNIVIIKVFSAKHSFDGFHYINVQKNHVVTEWYVRIFFRPLPENLNTMEGKEKYEKMNSPRIREVQFIQILFL